ncbi:putative monogalactosyldiacylglycerol synthase 3, chloroplastic [Iris pallida]|uniref:Monogalactosyldiacylglycerol synthase 3, chloroplastic n=1 Tax=Iris pallida TaxID=29817 RepID=A0AAX6I1Y6_IRIPA|nr:putative monogalactosyldiacylglycerol synthase 3, chloroplastic [Iris pallida]
MELAKNDTGNIPKSYSLNMCKDFVPMLKVAYNGLARKSSCITDDVNDRKKLKLEYILIKHDTR